MQQFVIYFYFFICFLILLYTIGYILFQSFRIKKQKKDVEDFKRLFFQQSQLQYSHGYILRDHYRSFASRFKNSNQFIAFDQALDELEQEQIPKADYLSQLEPMVSILVDNYRHKNQMEQAYLAWFIAKYAKNNWNDSYIYQTLLTYDITGTNIYLRENVLTAIYHQQDVKWIIKAFHILTKNNLSHHSKLVQDGLLNYPGDKEVLAEKLWSQHESFHQSIVEGIIGFITIESNNFQESFYELLESDKTDLEIKTKIMRYFRRHPYKQAKHRLIALTTDREDVIRIVATHVLSAYPSEDVIDALKNALSDPNWYVRRNASQSLISLNVSKATIEDVLSGDDQFAKEILSYHLHKEAGVNI